MFVNYVNSFGVMQKEVPTKNAGTTEAFVVTLLKERLSPSHSFYEGPDAAEYIHENYEKPHGQIPPGLLKTELFSVNEIILYECSDSILEPGDTVLWGAESPSTRMR